MPIKDIEARREYQRKWLARRRADFFADKYCVNCGSTESLELDHIDRLKKVSHNVWSWREERRLEELAKCQVLCSACHMDKTKDQLKELHTYLDDGVCSKGHSLNEVGFYYSNRRNHKNCSYCHHLSDARRRGHVIKSIEDWIDSR